jgi:hypothetical protein
MRDDVRCNVAWIWFSIILYNKLFGVYSMCLIVSSDVMLFLPRAFKVKSYPEASQGV